LGISRPEAVLIVDDDDTYVRTLTRELRRIGFPFVYRASSASQAIAMLDRVHPTLVFVNIDEHQKLGRGLVARAQQLGASVAILCAHSDLLTEQYEIPLEDKSRLAGEVLETLAVDLITRAQRRSRDSVTPRASRVA
jgi:two-component SAPR family response regulator